ncbi:MAG: deoxyribodipyrimidine photo-lyase, partial [Chthonomonadales bacterium]|nr:deoxyribodipyrimidine photo-lyase [Chthonomonadales bacterium]
RRHEPWAAAQERSVMSELRAVGCEVRVFAGRLLADPETFLNASGRPFEVFTPFYRALVQRLTVAEPSVGSFAPDRMQGATSRLASASIGDLGLLPTVSWDDGLRRAWTCVCRSSRRQRRTGG